jgi:hypothetical protein
MISPIASKRIELLQLQTRKHFFDDNNKMINKIKLVQNESEPVF